MTLDARVHAGFAAAFGGAPDGVARAPGRVNLIGEHTDYNDGFVLPCALPFETRVAFRRRGDRQVHVAACDFGGERDSFALDRPIATAGGWRDYVRGTVAALGELPLAGAELAIAGDVPRGSGLSSSASLEIATALAMTRAAGLDAAPERLARAGQQAEHRFAGVQCGIMDQLVSAAAVADAALLIDCRSLACAPVPFPADAALIIVQSGVERGLVDGQYNARREACAQAAAALGVPALRDADLAELERARERLSDTVFRRARHVVTENARVLAAADALRSGDLVALGRLMSASHASMRDDFAITVPAVDRLVNVAQAAVAELAAGRGGARMTGGGFGGAVVAIAPAARADAIVARIARDYPLPAPGFVARPAPGASAADVLPDLRDHYRSFADR